MALVDVLLQVGVVVAVGHLLAMLLVVERNQQRRGRRIGSAVARVRSNLTSVAPTLGVLAAVLAVNKVVRDVGVELSWLIGINLTGYIYLLESQFVAAVQSFAHPVLTTYFGFVYVFGYTFLLTFPVLAYAVCERSRPLRVLFLTYILNYAFGLCCYVLFVAYGPRNFMPELVDPLLYTSWPQSQLLVQQVNVNTNVFPSLHTSLSATVALLAYRFRAVYPRWLPVATVLAVSITVSTMYLGIHWATDVVAGIAVAWASVELATRIDDGALSGWLRRLQGRESEAVRR
ncbi:phosphatase PAP2 family protein [Halobellus limi]|jgi:membrane-associated phospholipid phosphatase|uniref:Inositol phosphorylceramide synthase n=1 Tax=Halobellus limi TaxID=699433 RepID=A0A1H6CLC0_9EURY|nr:phosphatase PAP2 family protein [Halobellus limi]QCC48754.1 inositol phosphorylceramide synthase [Halobellus limi]SEG73784.1 Membrane-associated phospholipid phosphatase [Halobellus limi]